ncbi:YugN family protein [Bacillus sonorensis]|uniref:YugN family protein n=1 Tax=Bacillus sonorensis TaxID=119858 RepID=UPI002281BDE2|nr:YugN family protein [Bacillus sonorensis]MCY8032239.1 YugN-like family protein [Bacillus sonorensis]MCY8563082.1 YugN-like family protein [Bacillus sonorensis]
MKFEESGIEGLTADLNRLDDIMENEGFVRAGQWDYERVTYDRRFDMVEGRYYLRVFGYAVEGDVGARRAVIKLMTPLLGKYYYPHGVEYGEDEHFSKQLLQTSESVLKKLKEKVSALQV